MRRISTLGVLTAFSLIALAPLPVRAQADFYKGKTVAVVIGAKTGSLAIAAQIVSHHLSKYIPGNPVVIFRQQPGGAHLNATGQIYNVAEPDGLTILAANPNVAMAQLAKVQQVRFDIEKFEWLGSSGPDGAMFSIRADLPYKTWKEFKDSGKELIESEAYVGQGESPTYGETMALFGFSSQILTDLTGATVKLARFTAYANWWSNNSGGTAILGWHDYTTQPPTLAGSHMTEDEQRNADWPKPGALTTILDSSFRTALKNGTARGIVLGRAPSTSHTYRGHFDGVDQTFPPSLQITYTK